MTQVVTHITEGYATGCVGRIAQLHAHYYAKSNGFGVAFEAKVASELADFVCPTKWGGTGFGLCTIQTASKAPSPSTANAVTAMVRTCGGLSCLTRCVVAVWVDSSWPMR